MKPFCLCLWIVLCLVSCQRPPPVTLYVLLDTSASFGQQHDLVSKSLETLIQRLDPSLDQLYLFRMDRRGVVLISEGRPPAFAALRGVLQHYARTAHDTFKGTPYRQALERISRLMHKDQPASLLILGDLADEKTPHQINQPLNASFLKQWAQTLPKDIQVAIVGIDPRFESILDPLRQQLGAHLHVVTAQEERLSQKGIRQFLEHIAR